MKWAWTRYLLLALLLISFGVAAATAIGGRGKLRPLKGTVMAGDFILKDLAGKPVRFSSLRGRVVLLNFWATWCPPCRKEMPSMERLYKVYRDKGFMVVAVSIDQSSVRDVRAYVDDLNITFPVLHDRDSLVSRQYSVPGIPASFLVSAQGKIAYRALGEYDWFGPEARNAVEGLLP